MNNEEINQKLDQILNNRKNDLTFGIIIGSIAIAILANLWANYIYDKFGLEGGKNLTTLITISIVVLVLYSIITQLRR